MSNTELPSQGLLTDPIRYPASAPAPVRTKRAFLLILLTLFVPGSAQIAAGDRKLGRIALRVTLTVWALVILALVLDQYLGLAGADALFGVGIALWLGWSAIRASSRAFDQLMDKEWPLDRRQRFIAVASRHPLVKGIHDLRTRTSGAHDFVQFHVWVAPEMTVLEAHRVMDEIEEKLEEEFPGVEVLIHPDPEGHVDPEVIR